MRKSYLLSASAALAVMLMTVLWGGAGTIQQAVASTVADEGVCLPFEEARAEAAVVAASIDSTVGDMPDASAAEQRAAEFEDITASARTRGITVADAYRQLCWQSEFSELANKLEDGYADSYAGAWIVRAGPRYTVDGAVVQFKGAVPAEASRSLAHLDVELRANRGFSEKELLARLDEVHSRFREAGYTDLTSSYDLEDGMIDVDAVSLPTQRGWSAERQRASLPAELRAPDVRVKFYESLPAGYHSDVHGGGRLEFLNDHKLRCTGGFNVQKDSTRGLTTAGHCDPFFTFENLDGAIEYTITNRGSHEGEWGDFRWFTVSGSETDDFYWTWGDNRRDVTGVRHSVLGEELCRFGRTTGRWCGDHVYKKGVSNSFGGETYERLTAMHRVHGEPGDSGGPWYWGTTAIGIHHGYKWIPLFTRDLFSEAGRIDEALGVSILR